MSDVYKLEHEINPHEQIRRNTPSSFSMLMLKNGEPPKSSKQCLIEGINEAFQQDISFEKVCYWFELSVDTKEHLYNDCQFSANNPFCAIDAVMCIEWLMENDLFPREYLNIHGTTDPKKLKPEYSIYTELYQEVMKETLLYNKRRDCEHSFIAIQSIVDKKSISAAAILKEIVKDRKSLYIKCHEADISYVYVGNYESEITDADIIYLYVVNHETDTINIETYDNKRPLIHDTYNLIGPVSAKEDYLVPTLAPSAEEIKRGVIREITRIDDSDIIKNGQWNWESFYVLESEAEGIIDALTLSDNIRSSVPEQIRKINHYLGFNQRMMSITLKVAISTVHDWIKKNYVPTKKNMKRINSLYLLSNYWKIKYFSKIEYTLLKFMEANYLLSNTNKDQIDNFCRLLPQEIMYLKKMYSLVDEMVSVIKTNKENQNDKSK